MRFNLLIAIAALLLSASALGALPGVTELRSAPEHLTDVELTRLLGTHVATADVVAIGESVHGSGGFLRIQARLVRYLVENRGVRLVVWENPPLRSLEFSRWLASCATAKSPAPLDVLYMPTAADRALWDWACDFNRAHPADPIAFRGMDVWDRPWEHHARIQSLGAGINVDPALLARIATMCPTARAASWADIESILGSMQLEGAFVPQDDYEACRSALTSVTEHARQTGIERQGRQERGAHEAFELAISASTLAGWLGFHNYSASDDVLSWNERDRAQGRNLMLLIEQHGVKRAVVAAHTSHVSHNRSPADWWGYGDLKSGVHFFSAMTGKKVFVVALSGYEVTGTQGDWMLPTAANSIDKKLHDSGHAFAFFPATAGFLAEHSRWWTQNGNAWGPYSNGVELVPRDHFDAYFFFGRSLLEGTLPQRPIWQP